MFLKRRLTSASESGRVVNELQAKEIPMKRLFALLAAFALMAATADISGNWKATADFGGQTMERTFVFKVDGNRLTGETTSSMLGKSTITDGKVEGDNVSFVISVRFQENETKLTYKGKVNPAGNEIKFTVEGIQGGNTVEWNAKKVQ